MTLFQLRKFAIQVARFLGKNRRRSAGFGAATFLSVLLVALPVGALATTLTMDEIPTTSTNGLSIQGVTFTFTISASPSTDSHYNFANGGIGVLVQDPSLEGNATGLLQMDFIAPTSSLSFSVARSTFGTLSPGLVVQLFDATPTLIGTFNVTTNSFAGFSEGAFHYSGTGVTRAILSFPNAAAAPRFAIDNLTYFTNPAPVAATSAACSPSSPAAISNSTGELGVLDPTNVIDPTQPEGGLVWPFGAVNAVIGMETGQVTFLDVNNAPVPNGIAMLPGVSSTPAFPSGMLNFSAVHLTAGTTVSFATGVAGLPQPIILLSCKDIVLDSGSTLTAKAPITLGPLPGGFLGANSTSSISGAGGFGPRTGTLPSAASLYPLVGGAGGSAGSSNLPPGGEGGPAILLSAAQRITVNGTINANGLNAGVGSPGSQGGAGGSVRLAGLLVEGAGTVNTNAGADSDSIVRSPSGPLEVQAFLQDLFAGTTSTTPIRGNAPVQTIPANLPLITFTSCECNTTGSLTLPDVLLSTPSTAQVNYFASVFTQNVPDGTVLVFRAVGTDGSVSTASSSVSASNASVNLTLNAGATYQIVITPNTPFPSLVLDPAQGIELSRITPDSRSAELNKKKTNTPDAAVKPVDMVLAEQWMKAFGLPEEIASNTGQDSSGSGNGDSSHLIGSLR